MRLRSAALIALSGGVASALLLPPAAAQHGVPRPLMEADSGTTLAVPRGTVVTTMLNKAAGTGYAWRYAAREGVLPVDARTVGAASPGVVGGPETQVFQFRVVAPRASVAFTLARPWEKDKPPAKTVRYAFVTVYTAPSPSS